MLKLWCSNNCLCVQRWEKKCIRTCCKHTPDYITASKCKLRSARIVGGSNRVRAGILRNTQKIWQRAGCPVQPKPPRSECLGLLVRFRIFFHFFDSGCHALIGKVYMLESYFFEWRLEWRYQQHVNVEYQCKHVCKCKHKRDKSDCSVCFYIFAKELNGFFLIIAWLSGSCLTPCILSTERRIFYCNKLYLERQYTF